MITLHRTIDDTNKDTKIKRKNSTMFNHKQKKPITYVTILALAAILLTSCTITHHSDANNNIKHTEISINNNHEVLIGKNADRHSADITGPPDSVNSLPLSPHSKQEGRYQALSASLQRKGVTPERLLAIFSSHQAKVIDEAAIAQVYKKSEDIGKVNIEQNIDLIVERIRSHLIKYKLYYDRLERDYGVNREIVAAILFKETDLGQFHHWQHDAFTALNSIVSFVEAPARSDERSRKRIERRVLTSRDGLAALIAYCHQYGLDVTHNAFPSSYAGAIGIPQFLPIYLDYAVSHNNTLPDLGRMADAILSVGNVLKNRFQWPGLMDLSKLQDIGRIVREYREYDQRTDDASVCAQTDLEGYPLHRFTDEVAGFSHLDYIAGYCSILMHYNFSSYYVLDTLMVAFYAAQ